jgi:hypothetical protein
LLVRIISSHPIDGDDASIDAHNRRWLSRKNAIETRFKCSDAICAGLSILSFQCSFGEETLPGTNNISYFRISNAGRIKIFKIKNVTSRRRLCCSNALPRNPIINKRKIIAAALQSNER